MTAEPPLVEPQAGEPRAAGPQAVGHARRHEERDVEPRAIALVGLALAVALALAGLGGRLLLHYYDTRDARRSPPPNPVAATLGQPIPPPPRLQDDPLRDLQRLRAEEDTMLQGYAWVERSAGRVRIPIERAMELLAARGGASP
jgi:hypothetical protein